MMKRGSAMLDGLDRMLDLLHDISDVLRSIAQNVTRPAAVVPPIPARSDQQLLSITDVAELLGISPSAVRGLRATGSAPTATKVGRRILFQREDLELWLRDRRESAEHSRPWREAHLPGSVGTSAQVNELRTHAHTEPTPNVAAGQAGPAERFVRPDTSPSSSSLWVPETRPRRSTQHQHNSNPSDGSRDDLLSSA